MPEKSKDWLNNFFEKNAWAILVAVIGLGVIFGSFRSQVGANTDDIKTYEEALVEVIQIQKDIVELKTNEKNIKEDVAEIKKDVKTLLSK